VSLKYWSESLPEEKHLGDLGVDGRKTLNDLKEIGHECADSIHLLCRWRSTFLENVGNDVQDYTVSHSEDNPDSSGSG
jgi:hypothetical protein